MIKEIQWVFAVIIWRQCTANYFEDHLRGSLLEL